RRTAFHMMHIHPGLFESLPKKPENPPKGGGIIRGCFLQNQPFEQIKKLRPALEKMAGKLPFVRNGLYFQLGMLVQSVGFACSGLFVRSWLLLRPGAFGASTPSTTNTIAHRDSTSGKSSQICLSESYRRISLGKGKV